MASGSPKYSLIILLDNIICFRAWGLILYGALPSNLALLGASKVKVEIENIDINNLLLFFFLTSILPIVITFLLIRARHRDWYLTTDFLILRSAISTFMILILATLICGFSLTIHNNNGENNFGILVVQAFLLAVVSLVVSSTLFIIVLTKKVNLPGLPSVDIIELMEKIRSNMRKIIGSEIWEEYITLDDNRLIKLAEEIKDDMDQAAVCTGNYLLKKSLEPVRDDIINLINILGEVRDGGNEEAKQKRWNIYFAKPESLKNSEKPFRAAIKEQIVSLDGLKKLKLGVKHGKS